MTDAQPQADSGSHPLQFKWTLWHDVASKSKSSNNYAVNLREIASFDTVEQFWAVFNSLKEPSTISVGNTYNLFKYGIEPKWEDPQNDAGGEWRVSIPNSRGQILDQYWVNTVLTIIGEGFGPEESDDIAGLVLNKKRGNDRLAIWTKTAVNQDIQLRIGQCWKETANVGPRMEYITFKDSLNTKSGRARNRYVVE